MIMSFKQCWMPVLIIAGNLLLVAGCATTTVGINARLPARNPEAAELRKVTVIGFEGPGGNTFSAILETQLASAQFDGAKYFTLLSGNRSLQSNASSAVNYGRSVGADGVYYGRILSSDSNDERFEGSVSQCTQKDDSGDCTKNERVPVNCTSRTIQISVAPVLIRVSDGSVIYSAQKTGSAETSWCAGQTPSESDDDMLSTARNQILADVLLDVAPHNTVMRATVKEDSEGLSPEEIVQFDSAVALAKTGDIDEACGLWGQINSASPNHVWTTYNLGVCAEAAGRYMDALDLYRSAQTLTQKTDNAVQASITRAEELLQAENQLVAQQEERERLAAAAQQEREEREAAEQAELARREAAEQRSKAAAEQSAQTARATRRAQYVESFGEEMAEAILAKRVTIGMPPDAVIAARGNPNRKDIVGADELWHYDQDQIAFSNGKVTYIGQ